jgi:prepilin-type processing-associated H-X9-DG protein
MSSIPGGPSEVAYFAEINSNGPQGPRDFMGWNIWRPTDLAFNAAFQPNPNPRMIKSDDKRHDGRTTLAFIDGHTETVKLTPQGCPLYLFNPLDR